jgi:hypothetical protein
MHVELMIFLFRINKTSANNKNFRILTGFFNNFTNYRPSHYSILNELFKFYLKKLFLLFQAF